MALCAPLIFLASTIYEIRANRNSALAGHSWIIVALFLGFPAFIYRIIPGEIPDSDWNHFMNVLPDYAVGVWVVLCFVSFFAWVFVLLVRPLLRGCSRNEV